MAMHELHERIVELANRLSNMGRTAEDVGRKLEAENCKAVIRREGITPLELYAARHSGLRAVQEGGNLVIFGPGEACIGGVVLSPPLTDFARRFENGAFRCLNLGECPTVSVRELKIEGRPLLDVGLPEIRWCIEGWCVSSTYARESLPLEARRMGEVSDDGAWLVFAEDTWPVIPFHPTTPRLMHLMLGYANYKMAARDPVWWMTCRLNTTESGRTYLAAHRPDSLFPQGAIQQVAACQLQPGAAHAQTYHGVWHHVSTSSVEAATQAMAGDPRAMLLLSALTQVRNPHEENPSQN